MNFYHKGKYRGYWRFWGKGVYIFEPNKRRRKYKVGGLDKNGKQIEFFFKRLPKKWIDKFDLFK